MIKVFLIGLCVSTMLGSSIYSLEVKSIDGNPIKFEKYRGKKILIVNIATESRYASQIRTLEVLQKKYADSLIIIGVPSNSFGNEKKSPQMIKQKLINDFGVSFPITEPMSVKEQSISPLYKWLVERNELFKKQVIGDFQKFLISSKGEMMAYFIGAVDPLDTMLIEAIEGSRYNTKSKD
jgi:glutathione peroxidase